MNLSDADIVEIAQMHGLVRDWTDGAVDFSFSGMRHLRSFVRRAIQAEADRALRPSGGRGLDAHQVSAPVEISSCATCGHPVESGGERPAAADDASAWIDVLQRLPPKFTEVLVAFRDCTLPACAQYTGNPSDIDGWCYPAENRGDGYDWTITHWLPLPLTPKELADAELAASDSQESGSTECKESSPLSPASQGIDHE